MPEILSEQNLIKLYSLDKLDGFDDDLFNSRSSKRIRDAYYREYKEGNRSKMIMQFITQYEHCIFPYKF